MPHSGSVAIGLACLVPLVSGETTLEVGSFPGFGVASVFCFNDDFVTKHAHSFHHSLLDQELALLSESSEETRVHSGFSGRVQSRLKGAGAGTGAGKGVAQRTVVSAASATNATSSGFGRASIHVASDTESKQPLTAHSWFGWMRFSLSFAFVVKTLCMMCNIFYQASPLPLVNEFSNKGDTADADLAPFIAVAYGGWQWCFYGLFAYFVTNKTGFLVLVYSNVVGATLGLYYVYAFTRNCRNAAMLQKSSKYYTVLGCIAGVQLVAIVTEQPVRALFFCGLVSSAWSIIASLSLLSTLPEIYETRNSKSLPIPLIVMGAVSAMLWIICGVMLWDPWITFPNFFAIMICTFGLYLCWKFPADGSAETDTDAIPKDIVAKAAAKEAELEHAAREFDAAYPSSFKKALGYVSRSATIPEREPLHDAMATSRLYGATGGTGDW